MLAIRRCRHGTMMYLRQDIYVGRAFAEYGEYSEGEVDVFRQCLRPGDVALDIGANFGSHTIPLAQFVGPGGAVVQRGGAQCAARAGCQRDRSEVGGGGWNGSCLL